jgi:hypothetical protein
MTAEALDALLGSAVSSGAAGQPTSKPQKARRPRRGLRRLSVTGEGSAGQALGKGLRRLSLMTTTKDVDVEAAALAAVQLTPAQASEYQRLVDRSQTAVRSRRFVPDVS